ncbi:glycosyltransferase involved in cell wall biosynthesis [Stella humosa]|uniref:Glycosyltransferase involved in cell wall biosynthesis n=1 Tax=Stella humosa TaxID=94 RepID=A0A3N1KY06_9PROT|nr:glycosyltransferase family 4 protein [Stella humosa]ROP83076.1 glycosyltransferase involved in cell wall biosynthesis [Stella humosa]
MSRPTLLYLVTEDWFFWSHRTPIARAARDAGFRVVVATREDAHGDRIRGEGFELVPIKLRRTNVNPLAEMAAIGDLVDIYRREKPAIVHQVAIKPVVYGTWAAARAGVPAVINALDGLGFVYGSQRLSAKVLRPPVGLLLRWALNRPNVHVHLQNDDDRATMEKAGALRHGRVSIIRGAGVDLDHFAPLPEPDGPFAVGMAARMIHEKGIGDLVEAARRATAAGTPVKVILAGAPDTGNPTAISEAELQGWAAEGLVDWWGFQTDVRPLWAAAHVAALPSSGEGLPKALLEAAACRRPLLATDVAGNREVVLPGETGLRVAYQDVAALTEALVRFARDPEARRRMGAAARRMVETAFSEEVVVRETLALYRRLAPAA